MIQMDYFEKMLAALPDEKHPHMSGDKKLVASRSKAAFKTYEEVCTKGYDHCVVLERACLELIDGLQFSFYQYLYQWVCDHFTNEIPDEKRRDFCLAILPKCQQAMDKYTFSDTDPDIASYRMETEIEKIVHKKLNR